MGELLAVYNNITRKGWRNFCELPRESSEDICKEFYANAYNVEQGRRRQYVSFVRGKEVKYDSRTIQNVLRTAHHDNTTQIKCSYRLKKMEIEGSRDEMAASAEVLQCIALPGVQWEPTANNHPKRIRLGQLKVPVRLWYHFVVSTIMPTTNHTEVGLSRAILLWAIMMGERIDLSQILADSIYDFAQDASPKASLGHSSLIQYICQAAGVEIPPPEQRKVPLFPEMNMRWISKTLGAQISEEGQSEQPPGQAASSQAREERAVRGGPSQTLGSRITTLEAEVRSMRERQDREYGRQHYEYERQHAFQEYMTSQMAYLLRDRPDAPPPFQPAPYEEDAHYAPHPGASAEYPGGDPTAEIPDFVRDVEDEEMDG